MEPPPIKTSGKRGHYKRTKGRNLVERLIKHQDAALAFAFNQLCITFEGRNFLTEKLGC